jgi:hypothetical protein
VPIYVEIRIRGPLEEIWRLTQTPVLHERWDLRFTSITYLERARDAEPQRFRYATRLPFQIENWAYRDSFGRETVTWLRTFHTRRPRRFDAYMIYSEDRRLIVDYMGTHQHLAVDLHLSVDDRGGLRLLSTEQRFYEGAIAFRFPLFFSGVADVCEWFDDASGRYRIEVAVTNRTWGPLFGYRGSFDVEWVDAPNGPPSSARPIREERRE